MTSCYTYKAPIASVMNDVRNAYKLIELYRSNRCLWDPSCKHYFDETETTKAWERLASLWGGPNNVDHVKEQINTFLEYFVCERNELELKKCNGIEDPKPQYMYYYDLQFLDLVDIDPCEYLQNSKVHQENFSTKSTKMEIDLPISETNIVEKYSVTEKDSFLFESYSQFAMTQPSNLLCNICCASKKSTTQDEKNEEITESAKSKTGESLICKFCNCKISKKTCNETKTNDDKKGSFTKRVKNLPQKDGKPTKNLRFSEKSTSTVNCRKRVKKTEPKSEKSTDFIAKEPLNVSNISKEPEVEKSKSYQESFNEDIDVISKLKIEERLERIEKILCDWLQKEKEGELKKENSTIKRTSKKSVSKENSLNTPVKTDNKGAQKKLSFERKQCVCVGVQTESDLNSSRNYLNTELPLNENSQITMESESRNDNSITSLLESTWMTEKNEKICELVRQKRCLQEGNLAEAVFGQESSVNNKPQINYLQQSDEFCDNGYNITEEQNRRDSWNYQNACDYSCDYEPVTQPNNDNWRSNKKIDNSLGQVMLQPAYNYVQSRPSRQVIWNYNGGVCNGMTNGVEPRPRPYFKSSLPKQVSWFSNCNNRAERDDNFMDFSRYIKDIKN